MMSWDQIEAARPHPVAPTPTPTVPCATCGTPTEFLGTQKCNRCWEVESRLEDYLRHPNARALVYKLIRKRKVEGMKYAVVTAQVVVRVHARTAKDAETYVSDALADKNDVRLILSVNARELTPEEHAHLRQEVPDDGA